MKPNHGKIRDNVSRSAHGSRKYSPNASEYSKASSYKDKAKNIYQAFGGKHADNGATKTPQQNKDSGFLKKVTNFYLKNNKLDESQLKTKAIGYLDKKGILTDKINKRYFRDNDLADHLKVDKKQ
jgi:hypothetical protein